VILFLIFFPFEQLLSDIEDYPTFIDNLTKKKQKEKQSARITPSILERRESVPAKGAGRQINIRQAFNSPFRPFVLASTSIGQEGLDFHLYCKKIFHWNLPANPIDFEQREGRIHRYQGLVIRLNLASKYKDEICYTDNLNNIWKDLFKYAEKRNLQLSFHVI